MFNTFITIPFLFTLFSFIYFYFIIYGIEQHFSKLNGFEDAL